MKKRMILMLVAIAVFLTAIGAVKYRQIKTGHGRSTPRSSRRRRP